MVRDNSPDAIRKRYDKANEYAIVTSNRIYFDSLRDIHYLLNEQLRIESECSIVKKENELLKRRIECLEMEVLDGKQT